MKKFNISFLFLISACGTARDATQDADVQLALKGASYIFKQEHLYPGDLQKDLNLLNWKVYIHNFKEDMNCSRSCEACTVFNPETHIIRVELYSRNDWQECPRISKFFIHELYHISLRLTQRFADPLNIDPRWKRVKQIQDNMNPCRIGLLYE